jgi:hypothetical protein
LARTPIFATGAICRSPPLACFWPYCQSVSEPLRDSAGIAAEFGQFGIVQPDDDLVLHRDDLEQVFGQGGLACEQHEQARGSETKGSLFHWDSSGGVFRPNEPREAISGAPI